jgi:hypothetical protein
MRFAVNPTTRALKASADLRLEAREALLQQGRGVQIRLYLSLARLYVIKFVFQIDGALLGVAPDLRGKLPDLPRVGHYLSPMTGFFRATIMTFFATRLRASCGARTAPAAPSRIGILLGPGAINRAVRGSNPLGSKV